jgi:hypothetical protein
VDAAERGVAVLHRVDDHPDADEVEDVVKLPPLHDHLLVDAPQVLAPAGDLGLDLQLRQAVLDLGHHLGQVVVALRCAHGHEAVDLGVALRVERGEREVFELLADLLHAKAVGERRIDVERLLGLAELAGGRHGGDRAEVVEAVGQLDDQDAEVLGHRHQHLAHGGGLLLLARVEPDALELGDAVDDLGDLEAELRLDLSRGDLGVLDRVVQEGGGDRGVVEADVRDDLGHGDRVVDVLLAAAAVLVAVGVRGDLVGPDDLSDRRPRVLGPVGLEHGRDLLRRRRRVPPPREHPIDGGHLLLLLPLVPDEALDLVALQGVTAAEQLELDGEPQAHHLTAQALDQPDRRRRGAARGEDVVHDEQPFTGMDRIAVDLELPGAVLEDVLLPGDRPRQLPGLADGDERGAPPVGDRGRQDETTGLDADDAVDLDPGEPVRDGVHGEAERIGITEQGRDVAKRDAGPRVVRDVPDVLCEPARVGRHGRRIPSRRAGAGPSGAGRDG